MPKIISVPTRGDAAAEMWLLPCHLACSLDTFQGWYHPRTVSRGRFLGISLKFEATWVSAGAPPAPAGAPVQARIKQELTKISPLLALLGWDWPKIGSETPAAQGCSLMFQPFYIGIFPLVLRGWVGWGTNPALSPARSPAGTQEELCCGHPHRKLCRSKKSTCKHKPVHSQAPRMSRPSGTPWGMLKSCNVSAFTLPRTKLLLD